MYRTVSAQLKNPQIMQAFKIYKILDEEICFKKQVWWKAEEWRKNKCTALLPINDVQYPLATPTF